MQANVKMDGLMVVVTNVGPLIAWRRFANHSSAGPNLFYDVVKVRRQRHKRVAFYAARPIEPGEELVFDYGAEYWSNRGAVPLD